ncbi:MAG TPA: hypothetical protein VNM90_16295, partial [Haliangium sp.]|nr:hypothetical protein [Haliangium sp.]
FALGAAKTHQGGQAVTLPAPIEEIPMLVEAGAVLVMLAPDVFTLAEHGTADTSIVHLADRNEVRVMAFPRGTSQGRFFAAGSYTSQERPKAWSLVLAGDAQRSVRLQASLATLAEPFEACSVTLGGNALPETDWSYDAATDVLTVQYQNDGGELLVSACP